MVTTLSCALLVLVLSIQAATCNGCESLEYECDNGECYFHKDIECDGHKHCDDGSDEDGCVNVGLAVGLSVAAFVLLVICVVSICILCGAVCSYNKQWFGYQPSTSRVTTDHSQQPHPTAPSMATTMTPATHSEVVILEVNEAAQFDPASSVLHWEEPPPYPGLPQEMYTPTPPGKPDDPPPYPV